MVRVKRKSTQAGIIVGLVALILMAFSVVSCAAPAESTPEPSSPSATEEAPTPTPQASESGLAYVVVDTGQGKCYDNEVETTCPESGEPFFGQDAQYAGIQPRYVDNGDGTVTDLNTGLMWQKDPGDKETYADAGAGAGSLDLGGYDDWRLPTIKELYSLILFSGTDVSPCMAGGACNGVPFVDTAFFDFEYGDTATGERVIDAQYWSATEYVSTTMGGDATVFGVNFADGRIKGYPRDRGAGGKPQTQFVRYVRGNTAYGTNDFTDNGDGAVVDAATGLMWMQEDSGTALNWQDALAYCENLDHAGHDDWLLPDAKELQSIVDYSRSPATTHSAAIDPLFDVTPITAEDGETDYPFYWSGTTHADADGNGAFAVYVAFGEAMGYMQNTWNDVHGAGAQRSDPKSGDSTAYSQGHGPQGDAVRIDNYARCVRAGNVTVDPGGNPSTTRSSIPIESAGNQQVQPDGRPSQGGLPPIEALNACASQSQGASCQFTTPQGAVMGTCLLIQQEFACVPAGGQSGGGQRGGLPPRL